MKAVVRWTLGAAAIVGATLLTPDVGRAQANPQANAQPPARTPPKPGMVPGKLPADMKVPTAPRVPTTFNELFAERNKRAVGALSYMRCLQQTMLGVRSGVLGPVPPSWVMSCMQQGSEWRGVFVEFASGDGTPRVRAQLAVRGRSVIVREPVDTVLAAGVARALLRGVSVPVPGAGKHEIVPVVLPSTNGIEVWFLPTPSSATTAVVGGDSVIQMSRDGVREFGHSRSAPAIRTVPVTSGASFAFKSTEERIPLISELMLAHLALSVSPDVRVRTYQYESIFSRGTDAVRHVER